ncbi:MAG: S24/S26 family peptidase, partial [Clostridia bacterium]|nr:S24/S26 family peptidase [Clostridia bacterium]
MQTKSVKLAEIYSVMEEMLNKGGTVNFNPRGTSMLPTIHNDGDRVVLKKFPSLKKYDLPLYIRDDGQFVLHRVLSVNSDGTYNMCGDN